MAKPPVFGTAAGHPRRGGRPEGAELRTAAGCGTGGPDHYRARPGPRTGQRCLLRPAGAGAGARRYHGDARDTAHGHARFLPGSG